MSTYDSGASNSASATSVTVTLAGAPADGKVLYAVVITNSAASASINAPAGWTRELDTTTGGGNQFSVFRKVAASTPAANAFTCSDATFMEAQVIVVTGNDTTTPNDAAVTSGNGTAATIAFPSITTVTDNALHLVFAVDTSGLPGMPAGYTLRNSSPNFIRSATKTITPAGAVSGITGTGGTAWAAISIAIRPASSGSTYNESASDAVTATDAASQQLAAPAAATDAATATDSASNLGVLTRSASDAAAATDAATVTLTIPASASDAATATDASSSASAVNSAATDAIAATDAATQLAVLPAAASDAAAVTDSTTNLGVLTRSATDAAAASDAATGLRVTLGSASDAVAATDTAAQVSAANVDAADAISAADAATVQAVLVGIVSDGFSAIDAAALLAGIYNVAAADVLSLLDVALADGGVQYARAPSGMGSPLIYPGTERPAVISGSRTGNINTARPANRGGRRS